MSRDSIRALVEAATPGPWHESWRGIGWEVHLDGTPGKCWAPDEPDHRTTHDGLKDTMGYSPEDEADAAFIAASRTAVPLLLAVADAALELAGDDPENAEGMCMGCGRNGPLNNGHREGCPWVAFRGALAALEAAP